MPARLGVWMRAAAAWHDARTAKIARIGDNMREVAVTEGDKVEAQLRLGYSVNGYGIGDLVKYVEAVTDRQIKRVCAEYDEQYQHGPGAASQRRPACGAGGGGADRSRACGRFWKRAVSPVSPTRLRTCTACGSCRAWPSSG